MIPLVSPTDGWPLTPDTPNSVSDGRGRRWPVIDGIPFLRRGREDLVTSVLAHLDAGRPDDALITLLGDQDDWWTGPTADAEDLRRLVGDRDTLSLRDAMALLRLGPVGDYFAHRWSDPTYLAGLALLEAHWQHPGTAFELACGIGHFLRELTRRGVHCVGADVVFAKCWLAKGWVEPDADYVVFDAAGTWPIGGAQFDLVGCHDAFYFLPRQEIVADLLRTAVAPDGVLAVSHLHNADFRSGAKGPARHAAAWKDLFPNATVYDERALLSALMGGHAPQSTGWVDDPSVEAWSLTEDDHPARTVEGGLALPPADADLRPNPLLDGDVVQWPSTRYRDEYAADATWVSGHGEPVRTRRVVDLPKRW